MREVFVDHPGVLAQRLSAIPDDGQDYRITIAGGTYQLTQYQILVDHRSGGKIIFTAQIPGEVSFKGVFLGTGAYVLATDIELHGLTFGDPAPYPGTSATSSPIDFSVGGVFQDGFGGGYVCDPTRIYVANCTTIGASRLVLNGSSNSGIYTDIQIRDCRGINIGQNSAYFIASSDPTQLYANIIIDNLIANGINGPDSNVWVPGGTPWPTEYSLGTASFEVIRLDGNSTVMVTRHAHLAQIYGSLNHDLHCFRYTFLRTANVRITHRDCIYRGEWLDGHMNGDGGGNLWLGYYHPDSGLTYVTEGARPRLDFENVTFEVYIAPGVDEAPLPDQTILFDCGSDADYHFWDCHLRWDVPPAYGAVAYDLFVASANSSIWLHSTPASGTGSVTNALAGNQRLYQDSESRFNLGQYWGRVPTP